MNKRPINKMLAIIIEEKSDLTRSHQYNYFMKVLEKENDAITYAEKLAVREALHALCAVCGLSYDRLIMKVCKES